MSKNIQEIVNLITFDIDGTVWGTSLHNKRLNPHFLPLFYFDQGVAQESNSLSGPFFCTHRTPRLSQQMTAMSYKLSLGTEEKSIALMEATRTNLQNLKQSLQELGIKNPVFVCADQYSTSISNERGNIQASKNALQAISNLSEDEEKDIDASLFRFTNLELYGRDQAENTSFYSKRAHIDYSIGKFPDAKNRSFNVLHIDDAKFKDLEIDEKGLKIQQHHLEENKQSLGLDRYQRYLEANKLALVAGAKHNGLDKFANKLLEMKETAFSGKLFKDLAAVHYLLLTVEPSSRITRLVENFYQEHGAKLNQAQNEALLQAISIHKGTLLYALNLILSSKFTNDKNDFEAITYLLRYIPCDLGALKKLVLKFSVEKLNKLPPNKVKIFINLAKKVFSATIATEIGHNILLDNINGGGIEHNIQTLVNLYKFYSGPLKNLRLVQDFNNLFEGHLKLITNLHLDGKLPPAFLLDFVNRIFPYLELTKKNEFVREFLSDNSSLKKNVCVQIKNVILEQYANRTNVVERYFSTISEEDKLAYPADFLDGCQQPIGKGVLKLANSLEIDMLHKMANKGVKVPKEEVGLESKEYKGSLPQVEREVVPEIPPPTLNLNGLLARLLANFNPSNGPSEIKSLLDSSYTYKNEKNVTCQGSGWHLLHANFKSNEKSIPFICHLHQKAQSEFKKNPSVETKRTVDYIEKIAMPKIYSMPPKLYEVIFDNEYWASKSKWSFSIPENIKKMQKLILTNILNGQRTTPQDLYDIVSNRQENGAKQFCFFTLERNDFTEKLYQILGIETSGSWLKLLELTDSKSKFDDICKDRERFHKERPAMAWTPSSPNLG